MRGAIDLNDFGADPTTVVDSTAAIQAAVDAACPGTGVRYADRPLILDGVYRITAPIRVRSVRGFRMLGTAGSGLVATANMDSMLDLNGVAHSTFAGFELTGSGTATVQRAIHLYWDSATAARSTTLTRFRDIDIHALRYVTGIELGRTGDGNQVDQTTLRDISITGGDWTQEGLYQHGLVVGDSVGANNLIHNGFGLHIDGHRYNLDVRGSQFAWLGGHLGGAESDIRFAGTSYLRVAGARSENSQRLFITGGGAGWASNVTLDDITWRGDDLHADGQFVKWAYGGTLRLGSIQVQGPAVDPVISMHGAAPALVIADGISIVGTGPATAAGLFALSSSSRALARGVALTDADGLVTSVTDYDSTA